MGSCNLSMDGTALASKTTTPQWKSRSNGPPTNVRQGSLSSWVGPCAVLWRSVCGAPRQFLARICQPRTPRYVKRQISIGYGCIAFMWRTTCTRQMAHNTATLPLKREASVVEAAATATAAVATAALATTCTGPTPCLIAYRPLVQVGTFVNNVEF